MSERIRVYALARRLGLTSDTMLDLCRRQGLEVSSHMCALSAGDAAMLTEETKKKGNALAEGNTCSDGEPTGQSSPVLVESGEPGRVSPALPDESSSSHASCDQPSGVSDSRGSPATSSGNKPPPPAVGPEERAESTHAAREEPGEADGTDEEPDGSDSPSRQVQAGDSPGALPPVEERGAEAADVEAAGQAGSHSTLCRWGGKMRHAVGRVTHWKGAVRLPLRVYATAAALLCLVLAFFFLFVRPRNEAMGELRDSMQDRRASLKLLEVELAKLDVSKRRLKQLDKALDAFEGRLPRKSEIDVILREVWVIADAAGLKTQRIKTRKEEKGDSYRLLPIEMNLRGDFEGLYNFLLSLERLPGVMRLDSLRIKKIKDGAQDQVEANLVLNVYCQL